MSSTKIYMNTLDDDRYVTYPYSTIRSENRKWNEIHYGMLSTLTWKYSQTLTLDGGVNGNLTQFQRNSSTDPKSWIVELGNIGISSLELCNSHFEFAIGIVLFYLRKSCKNLVVTLFGSDNVGFVTVVAFVYIFSMLSYINAELSICSRCLNCGCCHD